MEWMKKKVFGIPLVYIAGLFVAILVVIAWRMRSGTDAVDTDPDSDSATDAVGDADPSNPYGSYATQGTVTVQQSGEPTTVTPIGEVTNSSWVRKGAEWAVGQGLAANTNVAYIALNKYVNGEEMSVDEAKIRDAVVRQYGLPPEDFQPSGQTVTTPVAARRQGNPGNTVHRVKGSEDNDFFKLSQLYYGRGGEGVDFLEFHNQKLGLAGHNNLAVGTAVAIPAYSEKYYTPPKDMTTTEVAAKNGTTAAVIALLNNRPATASYPKGSPLRIPS